MGGTRPDLLVSVEASTGVAVLLVRGPVTMAAWPAVTAVVDRLVALSGPHLRMDLHGCTSCEQGVGERLLALRRRLAEDGGGLSIEGRPTLAPPGWARVVGDDEETSRVT